MFFNADDFDPENILADKNPCIQDVDPRSAPTAPWTGEELWKQFHSLKTKFAHVDEVFCRSENFEAGAGTDKADRFDVHIRRLLPNESSTLHKLLLFECCAL
jgi:hypothetical protein